MESNWSIRYILDTVVSPLFGFSFFKIGLHNASHSITYKKKGGKEYIWRDVEVRKCNLKKNVKKKQIKKQEDLREKSNPLDNIKDAIARDNLIIQKFLCATSKIYYEFSFTVLKKCWQIYYII